MTIDVRQLLNKPCTTQPMTEADMQLIAEGKKAKSMAVTNQNLEAAQALCRDRSVTVTLTAVGPRRASVATLKRLMAMCDGQLTLTVGPKT